MKKLLVTSATLSMVFLSASIHAATVNQICLQEKAYLIHDNAKNGAKEECETATVPQASGPTKQCYDASYARIKAEYETKLCTQ